MSWDIAAQTGAGVARHQSDRLLGPGCSARPGWFPGAGLDGRSVRSPAISTPGADIIGATLRTLQDWWRLRHPFEAGSHYLALCWGC